MHSTRFSIFLFMLLTIPFLLRRKSLEPFPAVLFPNGSITIKESNHKVKISYKKLYALNENNEWGEVDPVLLLAPIPIQYLPPLIRNNFFYEYDSSMLKTKRGMFLKKLHLVNLSAGNSKKIAERNLWFKHRLSLLKFNPKVIRVITFTKEISTQNSGSIVNNKKSYEKVIRFN